MKKQKSIERSDLLTSQSNRKNKYGQYFTPKQIAEFMVDLAEVPINSAVLEPCSGKGVFLDTLHEKGFTKITSYEIDETLIEKKHKTINESFVSASINKKFKLIIGNPPYIRWANLEDELKVELINNPLWNKYFNSLCDYLYFFILKSIELLEDEGQLIFICPEYWLNTTHSLSLRNYMASNGYFESIYHFNETPIFKGVTISSIIFKYIKSHKVRPKVNIYKFHSSKFPSDKILHDLRTKTNNEEIELIKVKQFEINERWLLIEEKNVEKLKSFETACSKKMPEQIITLFSSKIIFYTINDVCDIGNGLVSGLDKAFFIDENGLNENENQALIKVVKAKDILPFVHKNISNYIFLENGLEEQELKSFYPIFFSKFQLYKNKLLERYNYNRDINYWEWAFLRNFQLFSKNQPKIFVPCKERISNKNHFRFALVGENIFPTQDVTALFKKEHVKESLEYILAYLNNERVFNWLKHNGIVKGSIIEFSEKPLASIPFRAINWDNTNEVKLHDLITTICKSYVTSQNEEKLRHINECFNKLFDS